MSLTDSQELISTVCDELKAFLLEKNRKYGDSALNPSRIFSRSDAVEQIKVRIDDKLTRLKNQASDEDEDVEWDLLGYLVILRVAKRLASVDQTNDFTTWFEKTIGPFPQPVLPFNPPSPWWQIPNYHTDGTRIPEGGMQISYNTINTNEYDDGHRFEGELG